MNSKKQLAHQFSKLPISSQGKILRTLSFIEKLEDAGEHSDLYDIAVQLLEKEKKHSQ